MNPGRFGMSTQAQQLAPFAQSVSIPFTGDIPTSTREVSRHPERRIMVPVQVFTHGAQAGEIRRLGEPTRAAVGLDLHQSFSATPNFTPDRSRHTPSTSPAGHPLIGITVISAALERSATPTSSAPKAPSRVRS